MERRGGQRRPEAKRATAESARSPARSDRLQGGRQMRQRRGADHDGAGGQARRKRDGER